MKKLKILFLTDYCGIYSGFGRAIKNLLIYLYKNHKHEFELVLAAQGTVEGSLDFQKFPWKIRGVLPNNQQLVNEWQKDPNMIRMASYGDALIEDIVKEEKPDIIYAAQDEWGSNFLRNKSFFGKIPVIFHTTLDSLPIMKSAIETSSKTPYYWTWAEFAAKELRNKYHQKHVISQYPCLDTSKFFRLPEQKRKELRKNNNIPEDAFIIQFVFRNQLRKLVDKLIEAYSIFKKQNPEIKNTFLSLHTNFSEGWNIPDLCEQYGVDKKEILCSYICKETKEYFIAPFGGQDVENPKTKTKSLVTVSVQYGVSEEQLNEIYNFSNVLIHLATSGGCEMPIIEAALTEKIIATCGYSFGEDIIELNKGAFNVEHNFYTEIGSQFLKSNPSVNHVAKLMNKFYYMDKDEIRKLEKESRKWALENYSTEVNGKKIAEFFKTIPQHEYDFSGAPQQKLESYPLKPIEDNVAWLVDLYQNILGITDEKNETSPGISNWLAQLKQGVKRQDILNFFLGEAKKENQKQQVNKPVTLDNLIINNGKKNLLLVLKESIGDIILSSALLKSFREQYKKEEWNIYYATEQQYFCILDDNENIDKVIPYSPIMDHELQMTGHSNVKGLFDAYCLIGANTQHKLNYLTNNNIALNLK